MTDDLDQEADATALVDLSAEGDQTATPDQPAGDNADTPPDDATGADSDAAIDAIIAKAVEEPAAKDDEEPGDDANGGDETGEADAKAKAGEAEAEKKADADVDAKSGGKDEDYLTKDDLAKVPEEIQGKINRRMGTLTRQRKEAEEERDALKPQAERYAHLSSEMQKAGLSGEDMGDAFAFAYRTKTAGFSTDERSALLQAGLAIKSGDPDEIIKFLGPIYQKAMQAKGEVLEPDLQQKVDAGEITEAAAAEFQRTRSAQHRAEEQNRTREAADAADRQRQDAENRERGAQQQRIGWVRDTSLQLRQSDPVYARKQDAITQEVAAHVEAYGWPPSEAGVRKMVRDAHSRVTATMAKPQPKPKPGAPSGNAPPVRPVASTEDQAFELALKSAGVV